jgi:tRNA threonylcarbamoyladenosine biosynthesis protein TsaE
MTVNEPTWTADDRTLEAALRDVGRRLAYPPTPPLAFAVRSRLAAAPAQSFWLRLPTARTRFALGALAQPGDVILLVGELGSGKTCLAQGVAVGLGVAEHTRSPTFIFVGSYRGRLPLYHIDLYRLESPGELPELGLEEYLGGASLCVIEWADKALSALPQEHLLIYLEHIDESSRRLRLEARGDRYQQWLEVLRKEWRAKGMAQAGDGSLSTQAAKGK